MSDRTYRITEIVGTSPVGIDQAIKNGIKQNITKLDSIKKLALFPIACPKCKKAMKDDDINKKMYYIHGSCFNCGFCCFSGLYFK